nr:hypothetical protein [Tanacetum cinerariifolium]
MIADSIENGPYVRRMIATPGKPDLLVLVLESFHEQTDEELTKNDIKRMDADDQAIQTILLGLPKDVYVVVDSCETAKEIWEHKFLDKEVDLEDKIKDLKNILLKRDQTVQTMHMLNPKPNSFYHLDQKMALGYPNPSYLKKALLKQQSLYNGNLLLEEHDPPVVVFVPQTTKSKEELFLSNASNMVIVSKTISIPNEDLSDDTTPSVARKFLNEVKSSLVTLQRLVKQNMTLELHNWSSSAHKEIQFLQEATKFVRDLKSLAKEADESLDKQKSLELEIE